MKNRKIITITAVVLVVALVLTVYSAVSKSTVDYQLLGKSKSVSPEYTEKQLSSDNDVLLGENGEYSLFYRRDLMAFYIKDETSVCFTSGAMTENILVDTETDKNMFTLCQVGYTDFKGLNDVFNSLAENCKITEKALKNGIAISMWFSDYKIGLTLEVWINEYGLCAKVPVKSISEKGGYGITSITLFPMMGATTNNEDGFIVYPDGSGSLYKFGNSLQPSPISMPFYFESSFDLDSVSESTRQGQYNIMLPAFGITDGKKGVVSYVTDGDENGYLTLSPSGFSFNLNRVAASCMYRKSYSYVSPNGVEINEVEKNISAEDFSIQFMFMDNANSKKNITYGDMASLIRNFMIESKRLNDAEIENISIDLQIIMGTKSNSGMSNGYNVLTDVSQTEDIINGVNKDLRDKLNVYLLGWQQEGYGLNPAGDKISSKLGSKKEFKKLNSFFENNKIDSYMLVDYVYAQSEGKNFNKSSQAVYNEMNLPITNADYSVYLLNPLVELGKFLEKRLPYFSKINSNGIAFDKVGYYLFDDYRSDRKVIRAQCASSFVKMAENAKKAGLSVAVQGGNSYMLGVVDVLYDLPESGNELATMAYSIPFYQMVIHGSIPYSSNIPGNMAADYDMQKLKWIEYGSNPCFVLTYESSELLKNTYSEDAFATDYNEHIETINECIQEFSTKLAFTAKERMVDHKVLSDDLVQVTYESGKTIIINYGKNNVKIGDSEVEAKNYIITEGEGL